MSWLMNEFEAQQSINAEAEHDLAKRKEQPND